MQAPPQEDEARRLVALRSYHVLDTPQERRYDEITALAAEICETSVALITLIDAERQWVKSQVGFDRREIPRRDSFCAHALRSSGLFIVPDTVEDERFAHNPLVTGAPGIRFYAGAPLITPGGQTLGTLCVLDVQPRTLNAVQLRALEALSHSVMEKMELQREVVEEQRVSALLRDSEERYRLLFEQNPNAMWAYDLETLRFLCVNDAAIARYGFSREEFLDMTISDIRPKEDVADLLGYVARTSEGIHQSGVWRHRLRNGEIIQVDITSHSFDYPGCRARMVVASDVTDRHLAEEQLREVTRLTALRADVASCLSSEFTLPDIFQYCSELLLSHLDATFVGLWLQDPVARVLTLSASAGCEPPARQQCLMRIAASGQPELSSDLAANPAFDDPEWLARHELVAFAGYPIDLEGTVHGVLAIFSRRRFSEAILQELSPITNGLAQRLKRQLAEDQLRRSEASLLHAQEIARLGNWDWNIQTGKLYWSPQVFELVGIAPHEFTGEYEAFRQRVHPDDLERVELAFEDALAGRAPYNIQHRVLRPDGSTRIVQSQGEIIRNEAGEAVNITGTVQDITDRKQAEDERDRLFNLSEDLLCVANFDGRLEQVNPAWTKTLGWTEEELTSRGFAGFIHPEDHEATNAIQKELSQGRPIRDFENRYLCKDGSFRWLSWRCHPLVESSQIFGIARDVTDRRKNEERLVEQMALLDAAHEAILVKDMDERIIFWNKGAERTFGWTAEEVLGRKPPDLLFKNPDEYQKAYAELLAKGEYSGELLKLNKRGEELMIATRWTLVRDERGQPKSVLAMNSDVTEKKRLESQFLRAQRMDSIGTLAGGIAHDLNNMLAPILMSLEILKMKFPDEATEHLLDTLLNSAQRGADLVKQVLSFARGVEGERIVINPSHLLRDIQKIAFDTFPKSVVLDLDVPPTLWTVMGDPTQLHQVFLNLCVNARDAMPEGGQLNITLANIVLDETYAAMNPGSSPGSYVMIDISDTGTGIPPEVQERIFEPFFTTKEFGKGTGLGLSTTIGIIKSHKGFINLYSEVGKGSKFKVYLPASTSAQAAQEVAVAQTRLPRGDGELILVVDDEDAIRQTVKNTLERFNYRVVLAEHGAEAISLYVRHRNEVAVVITDMAMPVMDGPATIIALQSLDPKLKIIGSSGLSSNGGVAKAIGCGIQHFVPKPYTAEVMLRKLRDILTEDPAEPAA